MSWTYQSWIELKAATRLFGPWWLGAGVLWSVATHLQEPLMLRGYGIDLLWDGGHAVALLTMVLGAMVWSGSRTEHAGWGRTVRQRPVHYVLSGGTGLLAYGFVVSALLLTFLFSLDSISGQPARWERIPSWFLGWGAFAFPLAFLAPAVALVRVHAAVQGLLWLAVGAATLGWVRSPWDSLSFTGILAPTTATVGSLLWSIYLARTHR